ncbi:unnamed protein product [Nezara viridula]|uniref:Peptidase S1 domain-containing protein n=1 Tax=Nezara viridula TaxID=85310 RepID=A0A9P0E908_NEZVI|nr:unnamed protein product [Nezara viridula]
MRSTVSIELVVTWILIVSILLWKAKAEKIFSLNRDGSKWSRTVMTCNCSWGIIPEGLEDRNRSVKVKIIGGAPVTKKEVYPMMAGLHANGCVICGASILTEYHALTAAHCFDEENISEMSLAVGIRKRCKEDDDEGQYIPLIAHAHIHEYYDEYYNHQDIAIVVTQRKIIFGYNVGPTCIHAAPFKSLDEPILILGWGKTSETGVPSTNLLKVFLKALDTTLCVRTLPPGFINENLNSQLCTYASDKDACAGDSGGPLFVLDRSQNRLVQIALISMGIGCARSGEPGVNTAIYPYLGWIQWTIERTMRMYHKGDYHHCGHSFCYITEPLRSQGE